MQLSVFATGSVTLVWNASTDPSVVGYNVYYGGASGAYTNEICAGNATNATISGLVEGTTYYFAATTYAVSGRESPFSSEVSYLVPLNVPIVNQPPTLNAITNLTINENAGLQTVSLSDITSGATNENQTLTVTAVSSNTGLIPNPTVNYTSPNSTGSLTFTPVANGNGTATITVTVNDGGTGNSNVTRTFTVTVNAVNQPPTLNAISNLTINKNAGLQTVNLSGITSGAANENQVLAVTAVSSNTGLIPNPTVNYTSANSTGFLTFTPAVNKTGTATVTVTVKDGGTSNNIVTRTFTVTVASIPTTTKISRGQVSFTKPLTNCVAMVGQTKTLSITATGSGTLKYQWKFNGTNLPSAVSSALTLSKVTTNQAGTYSVMVFNSTGSTNSTAQLTVYATAAATLASTAHADGQYALIVAGVPGYQYVVQASTDLVNWVPVQTNTAPFTFVDTNASRFGQRFYRSVYAP
ncbi:MAG: Ig-like domain-containing protein [Verrucomicrobiota bacterium]